MGLKEEDYEIESLNINSFCKNIIYIIMSYDSFEIIDFSYNFIENKELYKNLIKKSTEKLFSEEDLDFIKKFSAGQLDEDINIFRFGDIDKYIIYIKKVLFKGQKSIFMEFLPLKGCIRDNLITFKYHNFTNIYNIVYFNHLINKEIEDGKATKSIMIATRLNNVEHIINNMGFNGLYGILECIYNRIKEEIKNKVIVSTFGDDKFLIYISNVESEEDAIVFIYNEIFTIFEKPIIYFDKKIQLSFKYGAVFYNSTISSSDDYINCALSALNSGENKMDGLCFYLPNINRVTDNIHNLKRDILEAFENRELKLYFHPYYDLKSGMIVGAEALIRWFKNGKMIPPLEFIPYLEQMGLIVDMEEWMLIESLKLGEKLNRLGIKISISINVSPTTFNLRSFIDFATYKVSKEFKIKDFITFEITERLILENSSATSYTINQLRNNGIKISIDDFGTGHSSLLNLSYIDIDYLKIDMSFIKRIMENNRIVNIVRHMIKLSHSLNAKVIAEGIESDDIYQKLSKLGCDFGQGYFWTKPISELDFLQILQEQCKSS